MQCTFCLLLQFKLDQPFAIAKPSRVIHFRGIPSDASESEVLQLGQPFGIMTNLVLAKKKNQVMTRTSFYISCIELVRDGTVVSWSVAVEFAAEFSRHSGDELKMHFNRKSKANPIVGSGYNMSVFTSNSVEKYMDLL